MTTRPSRWKARSQQRWSDAAALHVLDRESPTATVTTPSAFFRPLVLALGSAARMAQTGLRCRGSVEAAGTVTVILALYAMLHLVWVV